MYSCLILVSNTSDEKYEQLGVFGIYCGLRVIAGPVGSVCTHCRFLHVPPARRYGLVSGLSTNTGVFGSWVGDATSGFNGVEFGSHTEAQSCLFAT
jgi:hypothetical protein